MKKWFAICLAVLLIAMTLVACGGNGNKDTAGPATYVSKYESGDGFQELKNKVSWDGINAFPIKSKDMSIDDARQIAAEAEAFQEELPEKPVTMAIQEVADGLLSGSVKEEYKN